MYNLMLNSHILFIYIYMCLGGLGSLVGIATDYGLDGPGIESRWGEIFCRPDRPWGRDADPSPPSSADV